MTKFAPLRLISGIITATLASLAFRKATTRLLWKLSIAGTECGHILAALSFIPLLPGWRKSWAGRIGGLLGICSALLALTPLVRALSVARRLPHQLVGSFGAARPLTAPGAPARPTPLVCGDLFTGMSSPQVRKRTITYTIVDGIPLTLDMYQSLRPSPNAPCIVVIHGGSWQHGDSTQLYPLNVYLAARGYTMVAMNYRLAPQHPFPAARDDVLAALAYLKQHTDLGLDPNRIVLLGRSAGAHLAMLVAYATHDPAIRGVVSFYGFADLRYCYENPSPHPKVFDTRRVLEDFLGGAPDHIPDIYEAASPITFVDDRSPPTLLIHGALDEFIALDDGERLAARLARLARPHFLLRLPWGHHGGDYFSGGPFGQLSTYAIERFLASVLPTSY